MGEVLLGWTWGGSRSNDPSSVQKHPVMRQMGQDGLQGGVERSQGETNEQVGESAGC